MNTRTTPPTDAQVLLPRAIAHRTRGHGSGGPITRLMSPSDLGQLLKPFVFLDIFDAQASAAFELGSAIPHPHPLRLGNYSVHTSAQALAVGEGRIRELGQKLKAAGDRTSALGTVPVFR